MARLTDVCMPQPMDSLAPAICGNYFTCVFLYQSYKLTSSSLPGIRRVPHKPINGKPTLVQAIAWTNGDQSNVVTWRHNVMKSLKRRLMNCNSPAYNYVLKSRVGTGLDDSLHGFPCYHSEPFRFSPILLVSFMDEFEWFEFGLWHMSLSLAQITWI